MQALPTKVAQSLEGSENIRIRTVKQHRWRLWGLGLGDPCMIHGAAKTMQNEQIENYGISNTDPPCSRLVMLGEDSETMKAKI